MIPANACGAPLWRHPDEDTAWTGLRLLGNGLVIGASIGESNPTKIEPFFVDLFRGVLALFTLEIGMTAARQLREFAKVGPRLAIFGLAMPLVHGTLASSLRRAVGRLGLCSGLRR